MQVRVSYPQYEGGCPRRVTLPPLGGVAVRTLLPHMMSKAFHAAPYPGPRSTVLQNDFVLRPDVTECRGAIPRFATVVRSWRRILGIQEGFGGSGGGNGERGKANDLADEGNGDTEVYVLCMDLPAASAQSQASEDAVSRDAQPSPVLLNETAAEESPCEPIRGVCKFYLQRWNLCHCREEFELTGWGCGVAEYDSRVYPIAFDLLDVGRKLLFVLFNHGIVALYLIDNSESHCGQEKVGPSKQPIDAKKPTRKRSTVMGREEAMAVSKESKELKCYAVSSPEPRKSVLAPEELFSLGPQAILSMCVDRSRGLICFGCSEGIVQVYRAYLDTRCAGGAGSATWRGSGEGSPPRALLQKVFCYSTQVRSITAVALCGRFLGYGSCSGKFGILDTETCALVHTSGCMSIVQGLVFDRFGETRRAGGAGGSGGTEGAAGATAGAGPGASDKAENAGEGEDEDDIAAPGQGASPFAASPADGALPASGPEPRFMLLATNEGRLLFVSHDVAALNTVARSSGPASSSHTAIHSPEKYSPIMSIAITHTLQLPLVAGVHAGFAFMKRIGYDREARSKRKSLYSSVMRVVVAEHSTIIGSGEDALFVGPDASKAPAASGEAAGAPPRLGSRSTSAAGRDSRWHSEESNSDDYITFVESESDEYGAGNRRTAIRGAAKRKTSKRVEEPGAPRSWSLKPLVSDLAGVMAGSPPLERVEEVRAHLRAREIAETAARADLDSGAVLTDIDVCPVKQDTVLKEREQLFDSRFYSMRSVAFTADDSHLVAATERGLLVFLNLSQYSLR